MENEHRRAHRHQSHMDTCEDCIRQVQAERYRFAQPPGGDRGGHTLRVVDLNPQFIQVLVHNETTGRARWWTVSNARLMNLIEIDLTRLLG